MRIIKTIFTCLATLVMCSCASPEVERPVVEDHDVYVSKERLEFPAKGGEGTVHVTCDLPWEIIIYDGEGWVTADPTENDAEEETIDVTVTVQPNETYESRSAEVVFSSEYKDGVLTITQAGLAVPDECCSISRTSLSFDADKNDRYPIYVTTYNEDIVVASDADWLAVEGVTDGIIPAMTAQAKVNVGPKEPNTLKEVRTATVSFTGKSSGKSLSATVSQSAVQFKNGFPARWEYVSSNTAEWPAKKMAYASAGNGNGIAYFHVVTVGDNEPTYSSNYSGPAYGNMGTGDYVEYCVPVSTLEAGTRIDFYTSVEATNANSPRYWLFEYWDEGRWNTVPDQYGDLKTASDGTVYSYYTKYFDSYQIKSFLQSFTLKEKVENDYVRIRCRIVGDSNPVTSGYVFMRQMYVIGCVIEAHEPSKSPVVKDVRKIGILGNSFTYCYSTFWMLKSIARSQGHELVVRANIKGSQTFGNQLSLDYSKDVYNEIGYDYAIIQDQSTQAAAYMSDPASNADIATNTESLAAKFKATSPSSKVMLECTWSYSQTDNSFAGYTSYENFDKLLQEGTDAIAAKSPSVDMVSPIGKAFAEARAQNINMYRSSDKKHQSREGAYLKSCVNYLMLYGEKFSGDVEACGVNATTAAKLRAIAEKVVFPE